MVNIAILALENCIHSTVTGPCDIFSIARLNSKELYGDKEPFCKVQIVLPGEQPVNTFNGISINGTSSIQDSERYDIIITPALYGNLDSILENHDVIEWIFNQHSSGACICSVCASAFLVARTGIMNGKKVTTHWALAADFKRQFPDVILKSDRMLIDEGDIISAGGVTAYLDLCLYIINRFGSPELALSISKTLLIDCARQIQTPYSSYNFLKNHGDEEIMKAQRWLENNRQQEIKIPDLAESTGLGERTFNRRFKKATGDTPTEYLQGLRIEAARKMLETSNKPIDLITQEVGYEDTSSFRRLFKHHTGLTPSVYRKRFSVFYTSQKP